jgi:hypothetical protein
MVIAFLTCSQDPALFRSTSNALHEMMCIQSSCAMSHIHHPLVYPYYWLCFILVCHRLWQAFAIAVCMILAVRLNAVPYLVQSIPSNCRSVHISRWIRYFLINLSCTWIFSCPFILLVILIPMMNNAQTSDSLSAQLPRAAIGPIASLRITSHNASAYMFNLSSLLSSPFPRSACPLTHS